MESKRESCPEIKAFLGGYFGPPDCPWRKMELNLPVPSNSVNFGDTLNGNQIYVGRVFHNKNEVLIGTAIPSKGVCLYFSDGSVQSSTSYEILTVDCGNPLSFQKGSDPFLHFKGGQKNDGTLLYVGRFHDGTDAFYGWIEQSTNSLYIPRDPKLGPSKIEDNYDTLIHLYLDRLCICPPCPSACPVPDN